MQIQSFQRDLTLGLAAIVLGLVSATSDADILILREGQPAPGVTNAFVDDTYIDINDPDVNYGSDEGLRAWTSNPNTDAIDRAGLIAFTQMFDHLPNGQPINVTSATLELTVAFGGTDDGDWESPTIYRVTTDWLGGNAGANESNVTWNHADVAGGGEWAAGGFSTADYTTDNAVSFTYGQGYGAPQIIDVTGIVQDMIDLDVNYGFTFMLPDVSTWDGSLVKITYGSSENTSSN